MQKASEYVIVNGGDGEEPVLISELYPRVRGVAVVCTGGKNAEVKNRVTELIAAALGISVNKIAVSG
jgi:stage III sporulation protein AG